MFDLIFQSNYIFENALSLFNGIFPHIIFIEKVLSLLIVENWKILYIF